MGLIQTAFGAAGSVLGDQWKECPSCGATTIPDAKGCCEYCGGALS